MKNTKVERNMKNTKVEVVRYVREFAIIEVQVNDDATFDVVKKDVRAMFDNDEIEFQSDYEYCPEIAGIHLMD